MASKYESIVFLQREEAQRAIRILEEDSPEAAMEFLKQWHDPGEGTLIVRPGDPWQETDETYANGDFVLYYNLKGPHIGLVCKIK